MKTILRPLTHYILAVGSLFVLSHSAEAGGFRGRKHVPPPKPVYVAIASVDKAAMTITTETKNSTAATASKTYKISPKAKITVSGRDGTLDDLKPGLQVRVGAGMDAGTAEEISVQNPPPDPK